ncbi:MAG: hypothetical protein D6732_03840 [Methanobacteriota archaeon]|nr:MAG: hypothetical protein D6732_03840 [Euryarchaeota archaeon]
MQFSADEIGGGGFFLHASKFAEGKRRLWNNFATRPRCFEQLFYSCGFIGIKQKQIFSLVFLSL